MKQYLDLLNHIIQNGVEKKDRTGVGTFSTFGYQTRFDLSKGFPLVTTKKIHLKSVIHELLWFINGDSNINYLNESHIDQLKILLDSLKNNPNSRRHIVSAWNVGELDEMALPPCHCLFQFYIANNKLSCQLYQRSADAFLGVPFNIASYSLLLHMIAHVLNFDVGDFIYTVGDLHLYSNHLEQAKLQVLRKPYDLPSIKLNTKTNDLFSFKYTDFEIINYKSHPHISGEIAI
jgi:thymidylate synthase